MKGNGGKSPTQALQFISLSEPPSVSSVVGCLWTRQVKMRVTLSLYRCAFLVVALLTWESFLYHFLPCRNSLSALCTVDHFGCFR